MSVDVVGAGAGRIGRYFTVVSALPATVFVTYVYLLVRVTDWFGPVDWSRIADFKPQELVVLGVAALVVALALNPLQLPLIQLFEGYWGTSTLAVRLAAIRTAHHDRRRITLEVRAGRARQTLDRDESSFRWLIEEAESQRVGRGYPDRHRLLPTRLGNALRRWEDAITRPYGLDPLVAVPRLAMVARQPEIAYLENQRVQLELAIRTTFLSLIASVLTVALFVRSGPWLLFACAPYAAGYLAYRGAVSLASEYGTALAVLTEMNRFRLYDRLHLIRPQTTDEERVRNRALVELFKLSDKRSVRYEHRAELMEEPEQPGGADPAP
ncbi:hypothetical protein AB0M02_21385 [Actinoplanes sp. NPDC051861]|uniref:hypothetical protein n=1 Tax=Actinoplanes sp. NPDC051861 TaxID=3155170 RepID=UPI003437BC7B